MSIDKNWNSQIGILLLTVIVINMISFRFILKGSPLFADRFSSKSVSHVDDRLLIGSIIFGIGLGLSGLTPGTGIVNFFLLGNVIHWFFAMVLGMFVADLYTKKVSKKGLGVQEPFLH